MDKTACLFLLISFCWGCSSSSTTEKFQDERDNIINVRDQIKEIPHRRSPHWPFAYLDLGKLRDQIRNNRFISLLYGGLSIYL